MTVSVGKRERIIWISLAAIITVVSVIAFARYQATLAIVNQKVTALENEKTTWAQREKTLTSQITELEEVHILPLDITLEDQKEVEKLIYDYFNALERKDYLHSWELMSAKYKSSYKDFDAYHKAQQNSVIESIKLTGIKGYIPPYKTEEFVTIEAPEGVPTIWFEAYFELKLSKDDPIWVNGENERFVIVEKEDDIWRIGGLASSP